MEPKYQPLFLLDIVNSDITVNNDTNLYDNLDNYYILKLKKC